MCLRSLPALLALSAAFLPTALADVSGPVPTASRTDIASRNPVVPGIRIPSPPTMDGSLDDPCWRDAPVVTGFTRDTKPATLETEARVLYTGQALYVALTCRDTEPSRIRGQQRKRNGNMDGDDTVSVGIDTRCDGQSAYWFTVNASGTQAESIPGGSASKVEWRGDWRAASRVNGEGWTAEMEIPFALLRYPRGQRAFGLLFGRFVPRLREGSSWPCGTHPDNLHNEGRLEPVEAPRYRPVPRVMPYILGGSGSFESSTGLDVKYTTEDESTLLLTLRPDFQTIEEAIREVDFSYNARRVNDRRPFFTEGGDFLGSRFEFYSPSIGEVDTGAKAFGRNGPFQFAGLATSQFGKETDVLGALSWDPSASISLWGGAMSHRWQDDAESARDANRRNSVWMLAARHWLPLRVNGVESSVKYFHSRTTGAGSDGHQLRLEVNRWDGDGTLGGGVTYREVTPDYDARLSYMPEVNLRGVNGWVHYPRQIKKGPLRRIGFYTSADWTNRYSGGMHHRGTFSCFYTSFRNDTGASLILEVGTRRNDGATPVSTDVETGEVRYTAERVYDDRILEGNFGWRESDIYRSGGVSLRGGSLAGGPYAFGNAWQGLRFGEKTSGSVSVNALHLDGQLEKQHTWRVVASGLYEFSPERSVAGRLIGGHRSENGERAALHNAFAAYRQEVRRGADIYLLVGDPNTNDITANAAMKFVRTY